MKKVIMALGLSAIVLGNTAMAHGREIDKNIQQSFDKQFAGAVDVQWSSNDQYVEVDFTFNNMRLYAYYNTQGEILAVIRNVSFSSLPVSLQFDLKKNYKDYWITKICDVTNKEGQQYRVTLEKADKTLLLVSNGSYSWEVIKKEAE